MTLHEIGYGVPRFYHPAAAKKKKTTTPRQWIGPALYCVVQMLVFGEAAFAGI